MRASRLLSVLLLLQTRGKLTAEQLADELEVSVRTIYRDLEALGAAGVPVYADRGPAGGYRLVGGYRTRLTGLTPDEADALFLPGGPDAAAELGLGGVLAAAQLKVLAALPPELRERTGRVRERFHLDVPDWFRDLERPPFLDVVADAVWQQRVLDVRYERWGRETVERRLQPYGVVLKAGVWYLAARPHPRTDPESGAESPAGPGAGSGAGSGAESARDTWRTYRISRIRRVTELDERFDRDPGFDLAAYWSEWNARYAERLYRERAVVRLAPIVQELLAFYLGRHVARVARETSGEPDADGWVTATLPIESVRHATFELLRFGSAVEVLEPAELRERIADEAAAVAARYGTALPNALSGRNPDERSG